MQWKEPRPAIRYCVSEEATVWHIWASPFTALCGHRPFRGWIITSEQPPTTAPLCAACQEAVQV